MDSFLDIHEMSLNKTGEELCGDQVKILHTEEKTIIVLSDGLGSGVKASILSTLTSSIIVTLGRSDVPLDEVIKTVIGTLPIDKYRKVAYATFTIVEITRGSGSFRIVNFDNPRSFYFKAGRQLDLEVQTQQIEGHEIAICNGVLARGDFLALISDGVLYAGLGNVMDFGWGRENIGHFIEGQLIRNGRTAQAVVRGVMNETSALYNGKIGDDATFVGIYARERHSLAIFTGPPLDQEQDERYIDLFMDFKGRKVVCGGTTANMIAAHQQAPLETDISSMRADVPPAGSMPGVDLVTEGIFTMSKCLELMRASGGDPNRLPGDHNGADMLARELLRADTIRMIVGQSINEWYQNPLLPRSISIRRQLVEEIAEYLKTLKKEVRLEFC